MAALLQIGLDTADQFLVGVVTVAQEDPQGGEWLRFQDLAMPALNRVATGRGRENAAMPGLNNG